MQMFHPNASPYIFQYPTNPHNLTPDVSNQLNAFHHSQTQQLPNSNTLISPASQYSSAFAPNNLNVAFIPGLGQTTATPFLNAATQQLAAAQAPMFSNPFFVQAVPSSMTGISGIIVGSAILKDLNDSTTADDLNVSNNLLTTNNIKLTSKESQITANKEQSSKKSSKESSNNKKVLNTKILSIDKQDNLKNQATLNNNTNTVTTTSTETKSAIIKIKPSQALTAKSSQQQQNLGSQLKIDNSSSLKNINKPNEVKQNGTDLMNDNLKNNDLMKSSLMKNKTLATGIRKERRKKIYVTSKPLVDDNKSSVKVNNLNIISNQQSKLNQQVDTKLDKEQQKSPNSTKLTIDSNNQSNNQRLTNQSIQKNFLPCSAPEPTQLNLIELSNTKPSTIMDSKNNVTNLVLLSSKPEQAKKESYTIQLLNKKDNKSPPKGSNSEKSQSPKNKTAIIVKTSPDQTTISKKLKIDSNQSTYTIPLMPIVKTDSSITDSIKNSITITPIALNSTKESSSLTTVQLDTASMRISSNKKSSTASTNNMFNQTGKSLTIHPCNFYSNSAVALNSSSPSKKLIINDSLSTKDQLNNLPKVNDVNLDSTNDSSMKGSNKKSAKSSNQVKHNEKIVGHEQIVQVFHGWKFEGEPVKKSVMISVGL